MQRTDVTSERLVGVFLLGTLLFTLPLLSIFNSPRLVLGIPVLFLYLFAAWIAVIAVAAIVLRRGDGT